VDTSRNYASSAVDIVLFSHICAFTNLFEICADLILTEPAMAAFHSGDCVGALVVDVGSATTKIGWAGDDYPRALFRSVGSRTITVTPQRI
jgi:Actin